MWGKNFWVRLDKVGQRTSLLPVKVEEGQDNISSFMTHRGEEELWFSGSMNCFGGCVWEGVYRTAGKMSGRLSEACLCSLF